MTAVLMNPERGPAFATRWHRNRCVCKGDLLRCRYTAHLVASGEADPVLVAYLDALEREEAAS